jgi:hypothetical protein
LGNLRFGLPVEQEVFRPPVRTLEPVDDGGHEHTLCVVQNFLVCHVSSFRFDDQAPRELGTLGITEIKWSVV